MSENTRKRKSAKFTTPGRERARALSERPTCPDTQMDGNTATRSTARPALPAQEWRGQRKRFSAQRESTGERDPTPRDMTQWPSGTNTSQTNEERMDAHTMERGATPKDRRRLD